MAWTKVSKTADTFEDMADGATGTRIYYCESDTAVSPDAALTASAGGVSVPAEGASYSAARPFCVCRARRCEAITATQVKVTCQFAELPFGNGTSAEALLAKPIKVERLAEVRLEPYDKDADGVLVRNVVGDRFDRMPERQQGVAIFACKKYVDATTKAAMEAIWNTNNDDAIVLDDVTIDADCGWFRDWPRFTPVEGTTIYFAEWTIAYNKDGWVDKTPNYGFSARPSAGQPPCRIMEELMTVSGEPSGQYRPITVPWPLAENGTRKANRDDDPSESTFFPYAQADWSALPVT